MPKYRVMTWMTSGWEDCWEVDGEPWRFDTKEEAEEEIKDMFQFGFVRENFKIEEVED